VKVFSEETEREERIAAVIPTNAQGKHSEVKATPTVSAFFVSAFARTSSAQLKQKNH
jgi:hypothetical protein